MLKFVGKNDVRNTNCSSVLDREQLLQILSKINSLPLPVDLASKLPNLGSLNRKASELLSLDLQNKLNGKSSASTMDLITVLSATLASSSDSLAMLSQKSSQSSDSEKTKLTCSDQAAGPNFQKRPPQEFHSAGGERSSTSYQSPTEDSDCQVQETRVKLPLQLFSSSPEDDSPPKLASSRKYFSSDSSNRTEERSPSSSPPVMQTLFPMKTMAETVKSEKLSISKESNVNLDSSRNGGNNLPFDLFRASNRGAVSSSIQNFPHQAGYTSSGSDHSPSSLNSDPQVVSNFHLLLYTCLLFFFLVKILAYIEFYSYSWGILRIVLFFNRIAPEEYYLNYLTRIPVSYQGHCGHR